MVKTASAGCRHGQTMRKVGRGARRAADTLIVDLPFPHNLKSQSRVTSDITFGLDHASLR